MFITYIFSLYLYSIGHHGNHNYLVVVASVSYQPMQTRFRWLNKYYLYIRHCDFLVFAKFIDIIYLDAITYVLVETPST